MSESGPAVTRAAAVLTTIAPTEVNDTCVSVSQQQRQEGGLQPPGTGCASEVTDVVKASGLCSGVQEQGYGCAGCETVSGLLTVDGSESRSAQNESEFDANVQSIKDTIPSGFGDDGSFGSTRAAGHESSKPSCGQEGEV